MEAFESTLTVIRSRDAITTRVTDIDSNTGKCEIFARWNRTEEPILSVIAGDYIHNLRSALDYVVTALVDASQEDLVQKHQFPIYFEQERYRRAVGTASKARSGGPLQRVRHGLSLIEKFQPYHSKPDPYFHPLAQLHRLSNADKHRHLIGMASFHAEDDPPSFEVIHHGVVVDLWEASTFPMNLGKEIKLAAIQFARPHPPEVRVRVHLAATPMVITPAVPSAGSPKGLAVPLAVFSGIHACVSSVIAHAEVL